jgi:hypothetical protein
MQHNAPNMRSEVKAFLPAEAQEWLNTRNKHNRPMSWLNARKWADMMRRGEFLLHAQGIIVDVDGNLVTGQTRLQAVVLAALDTPVWINVTYNNPRGTADYIDRGRPMTARDLATRHDGKTHAVAEAAIARAMCTLRDEVQPSMDTIAKTMEANYNNIHLALDLTRGKSKSKAALMVIAVMVSYPTNLTQTLLHVDEFAAKLEKRLAEAPGNLSADKCWGRGSGFRLALSIARDLVLERIAEKNNLGVNLAPQPEGKKNSGARKVQ